MTVGSLVQRSSNMKLTPETMCNIIISTITGPYEACICELLKLKFCNTFNELK
jgi:hypothetical protein